MADWFAIHDANGVLQSTGTVVDDAAVVAKGWTKVGPLGFDPRVNTKRWNEATRTFDDVPPPDEVVDASVFLARFTDTEIEDILDARRNHANDNVRKQLDAFFEITNATGRVVMNARTTTVVNGMETVGLIGAGRAAEILNG